MFSKEQIGEYMVFGFMKPFKYRDPIGKDRSISFEDAKYEVLKRLKENVLEIRETYPDAIYTLSGGLDASIIVNFIKESRPKTICIEGKSVDVDNSRLLASMWKTNHIPLSLDIDLVTSLIEINSVWPQPHQAFPGNVWMWKLMKRAKEESNVLIVGTGSGSLLHEYFRFPEQEAMLYYSMRRGHYNFRKAKAVLKDSKYPDPEGYFKAIELVRINIKNRKYTEYFTDIYNSAFFDKRNLNDFDVSLPEYPLREDNLEHFLQWSQDWLMQGHELDRYAYWGEALGINVISPFFMNGFDDFLLSLPYEYCDCMGFPRHVYREAIGPLLPKEVMCRERGGLNAPIDWHVKNYIHHNYLYNRYILPKGNKIYDYLDYNKVKLLFNYDPNSITGISYDTFFRCFNLVNLSVWLETNHA